MQSTPNHKADYSDQDDQEVANAAKNIFDEIVAETEADYDKSNTTHPVPPKNIERECPDQAD